MIELSSNWKKLQAKIKAESTRPAAKRKADDAVDQKQTGEAPRKKPKHHDKPQSSGKPETPSKPAKKSNSTSDTKTNDSTKTKPKSPMGNAQSSKIDTVHPTRGVAPSLAVWAADNDISPESIAEAYGLGLRDNALLTADGPARPNEGLAPGVKVGKYVAIDCEMVGVGEGGHEDALARVSVVDFHGRQVYDSYVRPRERVVDWRTHVSGVGPKHMAKARPFDEVRAQVAELLKGAIVVGHDVKHDLRVLEIDHPHRMIRDTAKFSGFRKYGHGPKPALRVLAKEILGIEIQTGAHSSIEDARVAMLLFRKHKPAFDLEHANRYPDEKPKQKSKPPSKGGKGKKKRC
ncbi:hypothetical protein VTJ04DRAFT_5630 [Mycothermus thermophilus]|uniref:uncharacterized protein n=1 Tax=Humicola insolens TaxID=85995 RepID=UPI00374282C8